MRLIDADALPLDGIVERKQIFIDGKRRTTNICTAVVRPSAIENAPTIDAVPVVRCAECKHYKPGKYFKDINFCHRLPYYAEKGGLNVADNDFCSYGERVTE